MNPDAERKIYFYRALSSQSDGDGAKGYDRQAICDAIKALKGKPNFYLDEGQDQITCAEVINDKAPQCIKVYGIRRQNLPSLDDGAGTIQALNFQQHEGLAEAVHVRLYPNRVVAAEFFYYGPRVSRFQSYLNVRCGQQLSLAQLIRDDMIERALAFKDIRALRIKIHPSGVTKAKVSGVGLQGVMATAKNFDATVYADLTLRSEGNDGGFTTKVKSLIQNFKGNNAASPYDLFENFEIQGVSPDSGKVEPLNLLSDDLVRVVKIPRQSVQSRALDSDAAFAAIQTAYNQVKAKLPADGVTGN